MKITRDFFLLGGGGGGGGPSVPPPPYETLHTKLVDKKALCTQGINTLQFQARSILSIIWCLDPETKQ